MISNLFTILFAVVQEWSLEQIMLIYWGQSVTIGIFNWRRILDLKQFSTKNFKLNNRPIEPTRKAKLSVATFFAIHYGFFHLIYFLFLTMEFDSSSKDNLWSIIICIAVFTINHFYSYLHNRETDSARIPNIGTVMFFPYARIIPMHITIIFGGMFAKGSVFSLLLFLCLKTFADIIMHLIEHTKLK